MKLAAMLCTLSLLIGGGALMPTPVPGTAWISETDMYLAPWFKEVEQEILKKDYGHLYTDDPRTPQIVVLRKLKQAAKAQKNHDNGLAQQLVRDAFEVFDEGVRRHYYSKSDIEPITSFIRAHIPIEMS